jgi:hypothetical protein
MPFSNPNPTLSVHTDTYALAAALTFANKGQFTIRVRAHEQSEGLS